MTATRFHEMASTLACISVIGMAASMPISRALFNLSALLMITGWLLSGHWGNKFSAVRNNWAAIASIFLFAVSAISLSWAGPLTAEHGNQLKDYSRLLYIPLIITLLRTKQWQRRAWLAYLAGMVFMLVIYLLDIWFEIPGTATYGSNTAGQGVFYHHISQGMMLSFLGAYALHETLSNHGSHRVRLFWLMVCLATLAGIIAVGEGRTGQLSVLAAYVVVVITHLPKHLKARGLLLTMAAAGLLVMGSAHMQERFAIAFEETSSFQQNGERTSVGGRLKVWQFSAELFEQAPWLGHGIGSYKPLAYRNFAQSPICELGVCEQPHNQFILTGVEGGVLGLLALFAFLLAPILTRSAPDSSASQLVLPFLAVFVVTACFDSTLKIQPQSFFTVTTLGLLMASRSR